MPAKQLKRGRLWMNDGSCIRLRPEHRDHVWAYDFVQARTCDGRSFRMLTVIDEFTRECLAIDVARKLNSEDVLERLSWLMLARGVPEHIRSDNGSEFTARAVQQWLRRVWGAKRCTSRLAVRRRMATSKASTANWPTNCWNARCSIHCTKRRC